MRWFAIYMLACGLLWAPADVHAQEERRDLIGRDSTDAVLARVNSDSITAERFTKTYLSYLLSTGRNDELAQRRRHLTNLIATYLLAGEARQRGLDDDPAFARYIDIQRKQVVGGRYFDLAMIDSLRPPSEDGLRDVFAKTKTEVELRHLYFRDRREADSAYARLQGGEDFVDLANEIFDTADHDSLAGYLGWASYWDLDDAVAEAAFALPVGAYSEPVRSRRGWHILRVDDRAANRLLTEEEFARQRASIAGREEIRRNRLAGDRLVRAIMNDVEIDISRDAAREIAAAVRRVVGDDADRSMEPGHPAPQRLNESELVALRSEFTPETIVATYTVDGAAHELTAGMFFEWMPELPLDELRERPMAAFGRALRNEVLALKGEEAGLADDPHVTETVRHLANTFLAGKLRDRLRDDAAVDPTIEEIRRAYETLGYRELRAVEADFWRVPFDSYAEADAALDKIRSGEVEPDDLHGYEFVESPDVQDHDLGGYIRRAPLETPVMACASRTDCSVLHVADRELIYAPFDEMKDRIAEDLRMHLPEVKLLDTLRQDAHVMVDEELFKQLWQRTFRPGRARKEGSQQGSLQDEESRLPQHTSLDISHE